LRALGAIKHRVRNGIVSRMLGRWYRRAILVDRSPFDTIYHCCTQRTASQWFRAIFSDPLFYRYTGLDVVPYVSMGLRGAHFDAPFPTRSVATHLYVDYPTYRSIPKPSRYRTFFILRDPRDALVSWYFSMKYSHSARLVEVRKLRRELAHLDIERGISFLIPRLDELGYFETQRSWVDGPVRNDRNVRVMRYEDLAADNAGFLADLFDYLRVPMPNAGFERLCRRHAFYRMARGREQGDEDIKDHYRKGVAGDWRNHFTPELEADLRSTTGNLLETLGYE